MVLIETSSTDYFKTFIISKKNLIISNDSVTNDLLLSLTGASDNVITIFANEVLNLENSFFDTIFIKSKVAGSSANFRIIGY